ncbi:YebC/PmpR family DNA-binding transcriptional regulator [Natranaerofaba carboxydovora]|uniref:YebC/PmpR family DNA-binding transcriptional regulator n=1 Tax=Natranaerofaba carboxydovora TaxID=2742683 RepID=UPI001F13AD58|nr:YebC/PmpR family DNA-binding transcriptional regulator [Natranaerofaba carboxydovora]UMZ74026.1 putative transcriptional regulatory protein [Natranaerofaba carboxydovora]
MAGHSKWANIKHKKARQDAKRGKIFTKLAREIIVAAKEGGGDPEGNVRLRMAIQKAKENNMPNENIERAIKRGTGEDSDGVKYEETTYEGYGPGGVAILLEILTDNRNRTAAEIRNLFSKHGGNLGESGCVSWMFKRRGMLRLKDNSGMEEDDVILMALEVGAEDGQKEDDVYTVMTMPENLEDVKEELKKQGFEILSSEVTKIPETEVDVKEDNVKELLTLLEELEDHDDVQNLYSNFNIEEKHLEGSY